VEPIRLRIHASAAARIMRFGMALMVVLGWLALQVADVILSLMLWSEPSFPDVLVMTSPVLLAVPWILWMAAAGGVVEVHPDALVIRHRRVLRRPLTIPRSQVRRVLLDDGSATGRARFATGDPAEPLLWTDPVVRRQHADRPVVGDALLPNLAVVLEEPLVMDAARDSLTALTFGGEVAPPRRSGAARALLFAMEDLHAVRAALVGWPVEMADGAGAVPPEVAEAARRVPREAAAWVVLSALVALLTIAELYALAAASFVLVLVLVAQSVRRRQETADAARQRVRASALSPRDRATALAAIDVNLGRRSTPPPGR
jgi:hypothetical protein